MKKTILSVAVALAGLFTASSAFAQAPCSPAVCAQVENCDSAAACQRGYCAFDGLNLSADQQARVKALKADRKAKKQADRKADRKAAREAVKAGRQDYLNQLKQILTPEQYTQFLENSYVNQAPAPGGRKGHKGDFKGQKRQAKQGPREAQRAARR